MVAAHWKIMIIAGPNGTGKTTFAAVFLPNEAACPTFVHADSIAAGLNSFRPAAVAGRAGCLMVDTIRESAARGASFAFETPLSGRGRARSILCWRARGCRVKLFFLRLSMPKMALARVRRRGAEGGRDVPETLVRRRSAAEWRNFERIHRAWADEWTAHDHAGPAR